MSKSNSRVPDPASRRRRRLLFVGLLALAYPLLRFVGFLPPKKPRRIEINTTPPTSGVLTINDFILFDQEDACWAVSRRCTHLGCKVRYHEQGNYIECPCHQSRFTNAGEVVQGPAKSGLKRYEVEKRDTAPYYVISA